MVSNYSKNINHLYSILTFSDPCKQCLVSLLAIVNGLPKKVIGIFPLLSSKTGGATKYKEISN